MKIELIATHVRINEDTRALVERAFQFALGRFGERVESVRVTLLDENGPRGGVDKRCRVVVKLTRAAAVRVEVVDADFPPAIHRAADRLRRRVRTALLPRHEATRPVRRRDLPAA